MTTRTPRLYSVTFGLLLILGAARAVAADRIYDHRFAQWTSKARKGDPRAQYDLANAYLRGNGVKIDINKAVVWLEKSAARGYLRAQYRLGYLYLTGRGVPRDFARALELLRDSARKDYAPAQFYLSRMYAQGNGVEQNYGKALYWMGQAAAGGYYGAKQEIPKLQAAAAAQQTAAASTDKQASAHEPPANQPAGPVAAAAQKPRGAGSAVSQRRPTAARTAAVSSRPKDGTASLDARKLLLQGHWLNEGGMPAKHMPSELSTCSGTAKGLVCTAGPLERSNIFARVRYMVRATFGQFRANGRFMGSYQTKVLSVSKEAVDTPNPSEEDVPSPGWKARTMLRCRFKDADHIDCVNDNFQYEHFTRQSLQASATH